MSFLQTPQSYYDYFSQEVQHASVPNSAWLDGLYAAEYWLRYHERSDDESPLTLLCMVIAVLMPHRKAGSGFHAFWTTILKTIGTLPIQEQYVLWRMVFSPTHQGDAILAWNDRAQAIVDQWESIAINANDHPITSVDFFRLATTGGTSFDVTPETIMFISSIDTWFRSYIPKQSLMDYLMEQHNRTLTTI